MFLRGKQLNEDNSYDIIEIISSGVGYSIIVEHPIVEGKKVTGKIIKLSKKQFKKKYKKIKNCNFEPLNEEIKKEIIDNFETDKIGILHYSEEYVENSKLNEIKQQTDAEIARNRKILADDYIP